jgi:sortase B
LSRIIEKGIQRIEALTIPSGFLKRISMWKWIRRILMIILAAVFLFSGTMIILIQRQYSASKKLYAQAADRYTATAATVSPAQDGKQDAADKGENPADAAPAADENAVPITVDFASLLEACPDVVGWIYCEGTVINYPVVQAADNDYYLHRNYDGNYNASGSIFVEAKNRRDFADANTIVYGHHMNNGSMFAGLEDWADQAYYESHPVMWLLTPTRDYRIELVSGYTTSAFSDTYTIFSDSGGEMSAYLDRVMAQSDFQPKTERDDGAKYVVLSTCAYVFDNARYVLHGMLVPVDSAGGIPVSR